MSAVPVRASRVGTSAGELAESPAFVRRAVRVTRSYRGAFVSDVVPLRLAVFLAIMVTGFGVSLNAGGVLPAVLLFAASCPSYGGPA